MTDHDAVEPGHCGYCRNRLSQDAISDYFCCQGHQQLWAMNHSEPLDPVALHWRWHGGAQERVQRQARERAQRASGH